MAPNITTCTGVLNEEDSETILKNAELIAKLQTPNDRKLKIVWRNVIIFSYLHLAALYGFYLIFSSAKLLTTIYACLFVRIGMLGVTAGAHRLWSHRSYSAKWPLKLILIICNTIAFQNSVFEWSRDHRVHHKYSETDADPHNARRGFFFSHVGWLLCRKHPDVIEKGKNIDLSDLWADPFVRIQHKYYKYLMPMGCFIIPTLIPMYFWDETFMNAWLVGTVWRYIVSLNATWLVNSWAHLWGNKPYDRNINPVESPIVAYLTMGEGWHNYHHVFPWDYKTAELGDRINITTFILNCLAKIGWAYDMKTVSEEMIRKRVGRTGDGTHPIWGWGDVDQTSENKKHAVTLKQQN